MSYSRPTQNLLTLTLTSSFSEHTLILTLACFSFSLLSIMLPLCNPVIPPLAVSCVNLNSSIKENVMYSETCLNRYSFGPKKNIGLDRLSD